MSQLWLCIIASASNVGSIPVPINGKYFHFRKISVNAKLNLCFMMNCCCKTICKVLLIVLLNYITEPFFFLKKYCCFSLDLQDSSTEYQLFMRRTY